MQPYPWLEAYLMEKPGATQDYKPEWAWQRFLVGGRMFAARMRPGEEHNPLYAGRELLNLKCEPQWAELWRAEYPQVLPGFYSDKRNWNSVDLNGGLPEELLRHMIDESYRLVFARLTRKLQREILGTE